MISNGDHRTLLQMVPNAAKSMWNEWALRGMILMSLGAQVTLILLGNVRKYNPRTWVRMALWFAYQLPNLVASAALGILTQTDIGECNTYTSHSLLQLHKPNTTELMFFWAPFFLLHLGGPDAITALELEDNELWLRRFVEIVFRAGPAIYIFLFSWPGCSNLPQLSILVYLASFIKCSERIRALRLANTQNLCDAMLGPPDPGPNYPKFLEELLLKKRQGFIVEVEEVPDIPLPDNDHAYPEEDKFIYETYSLFQTFKRLFVDLNLTFEDIDRSRSFFRHLNSVQAFRVVEIELGFAFAMLYTKASVVYTFIGLMLRLTSVILLVMVTVGFHFLCATGNYHFVDIVITYLLISEAISEDIFSIVTMLRSDWTDCWLNQRNLTRVALIVPFLKNTTKRRWSGCVGQFDLLSVALEEKPPIFLKIQKFFGIDNIRTQHRYKTYNKVTDNLKKLICTQFRRLPVENSDPKVLCTHKGSFSLRKNKCDTLLWSTTKVEFDQSILLWHIATSLCYYSDIDLNDEVNTNIQRDESKHVSDYLLYLLVSYPDMLQGGIGMFQYRDTCAEAARFFKERGPIMEKVAACKKLLEVDSLEVLPSKVKGDRSKSVLFDGCRLALTLKQMERDRMWEVMSQVWIEILAYAATHCRGFHHGQQLRKGGEFLTHIWLLMAHLGITKQFQVSQGHARARVSVL